MTKKKKPGDNLQEETSLTETDAPGISKDTAQTALLNNPNVFAGILNYIFKDKGVHFNPDDFQELDSKQFFIDEKHYASNKFERDIFKRAVMRRNGNKFLVILTGLEAQSYMDWTMPTRILLYDSLAYRYQDRLFRQGIRTLPDLEIEGYRDESGRYRKLPVITITVNFTQSRWKGPLSLREEFHLPEGFEFLVPDFQIPMIDPYVMSDDEIMSLGNELGTVLLTIKYHSSEKELNEAMNRFQNAFENVAWTSAIAIQATLGLKIKYNEDDEEKGVVNMRNVWRDKIELGRREGLIQGRREGLIQGHQEGRLQGHHEGLQEGLQEGRRLERQDSACRMKQRGFSDKDIINALSLSSEEADDFLNSELPSGELS